MKCLLQSLKTYDTLGRKVWSHEVPRMAYPLQVLSLRPIVSQTLFGYWFLEWIVVDPKEQGER